MVQCLPGRKTLVLEVWYILDQEGVTSIKQIAVSLVE